MSRPLLGLLAGLTVLCAATGAQARPFTIDDLLHEESFGAQAIDPAGRWLLFERRIPYDALGDYGYGGDQAAALSRLWMVDLQHPGSPRQVLAGVAGQGVTLGEMSPSGRRIVLYRLHAGTLRLGVLELATRRVRWLPVTPEVPEAGRTLQWLDDDTLLVIARPDGRLPWPMVMGRITALEAPPRWAAMARGERAVTVFGSGRDQAEQSGPGSRVLLRVDAARGRLKALARGPFIDLEAAPDGRHAALLALGPIVQPRADGPAQGEQGTSVRRHKLRVVDLATGDMRTPLPGLDLMPNLLSWSPSGASLLVFARAPGALWTAGRLYRVPGDLGAPVEVGTGYRAALRLLPEMISAGWMGEDPVFLATPPGATRPDWYRFAADSVVNLTVGLPAAPVWLQALGPAGLAGIVGPDLVWVDRKGAPHLRLEGAVPLTEPGRMRGSRLSNAPPGAGHVRVGAQILTVTPAGMSPQLGLSGFDPATDQAMAQGTLAVVSRRTFAGVEQLTLERRGAPPRPIDHANDALAAVEPSRVLVVRHTSPEGEALRSWLLVPPRAPGQPPPALVVLPYLGAREPVLLADPGSGQAAMQSERMLLGAGYAVLIPSLPLPPGPGDKAPGLAARILGIIDAAAADPALRGTFDPQRLAIWGWSFGGYTAVTTIGQTDRFRAAISVAGLSDFTLQWFALAPSYRAAPEEGPLWNWSAGAGEQGQNGMAVPPWRDAFRYARNSALLQAGRIQTPLLLIHGEQDGIVISHAEAMFAALYRQGKDAQLATYWGEGHLFNSPGNIRDMWGRALAFLAEHLAPATGVTAANPEPASASSGPRPPPRPTRAPPTSGLSE
jgi:dipeptidyl aminopeptidase/acylaminoacyl peptidase